MSEWFAGSKEGLEKIARRRGLTYVLFELVQNAWDTGAKKVTVSFDPIPNQPFVWVKVEDDDPEGFQDLSHAYTLFAESSKKADPTKRGRFNLGEKLVLAVCEYAHITSMKGKVIFDESGRTVVKGTSRSAMRETGSCFLGKVRMTREELKEVLAAARLLIPPPGVTTQILSATGNWYLEDRNSFAEFETTLKTEIADENGFLKEADRKTMVTVHRPFPGQPGRLFEMGIPVCETGDTWDVNIHQKVPVNLERNSVSAAYLRAVRVHVLNTCHEWLPKEAATSVGIQEAIGDKRISAQALETVLVDMFGKDKVIADPSDREAENRLKEAGFTVIHGRSLSPEVFENIRRHGTVEPAGRVSPSYKPYSDNPNAQPAKLIPESEWTHGMRDIAKYAQVLARELLEGEKLIVRFEASRGKDPWGANFGPSGDDYVLTFNYARCRNRLDGGVSQADSWLNDLLIHEFAHKFGDHLTKGFMDAMSRIGAAMVKLALREPKLFTDYYK